MAQIQETEEVHGVEAAAAVARITVAELDEEMSCFRLPFLEVGGQYIFLRSSLERLAAEASA